MNNSSKRLTIEVPEDLCDAVKASLSKFGVKILKEDGGTEGLKTKGHGNEQRPLENPKGANKLPAKKSRFEIPTTEEIEAPLEPPTPLFQLCRQQEPVPSTTCSHIARSVDHCEFCLQPRCITKSELRPLGRGNPRPNNHVKRRKDYKWFWRTLKDCGLWENEDYQRRKAVLGCHIDDVREVMPNCVVENVRGRWPNPPHIPYQGHKRN